MLTDAEQRDLEGHVEQAKALHPKIEQMEKGLKAMDVVEQLVPVHTGTKDGMTLGGLPGVYP